MTAQQIAFGVGSLILRRNDIVNPTPIPIGVLQDVNFDFSFAQKDLVGQFQLAVDTARAQEKLTCKAKFARVFSGAYDTFFGQGVTSGAGVQFASNENHIVAATTQVVTNNATFTADLGVFYAATGVQLTRVAAGSEATGKYSVNEATGTYTFAVGDEVSLNFNYSYTTTTLKQLTLSNQFMGVGPRFGVYMTTLYLGNYVNFVFNNATSEKLANPFKNTDYLMQELDFTIMADASNNIGSMSFSQ